MTRRGRLRLAALDLADEPVLPTLVVASVVLHGGAWVAGALVMGAGSRGTLDFVLWWTWAVAGMLGGWLGSRCLALPLTTGSARWILAGPVSVVTWALERVLVAAGVGAAATVVLAVQTVPYGGTVAWTTTVVLENLLIVTLGAVLGIPFRPLLALALTGSITWIAHLVGPWTAIMQRTGHGGLATLVVWLPDADLLDVHADTVAGSSVSLARIGLATLGTGAWLMALAGGLVVLLSRRRDL